MFFVRTKFLLDGYTSKRILFDNVFIYARDVTGCHYIRRNILEPYTVDSVFVGRNLKKGTCASFNPSARRMVAEVALTEFQVSVL